MNRFGRRWLAAFATLPALAPISGFAQTNPAPVPMVGEISTYQMEPDGASPLLRQPLPAGPIGDWVRTNDYPAEAVAASQRGEVRLRVAVDASGTITACAPVEPRYANHVAPEALRTLACRLVRERGRFLHALDGKGKPIAAETTIGVDFGLIPADRQRSGPPPAPPAPPRPSGGYVAGWRMTVAPDWQAFAPAGNPDGDVAVNAIIFPPRGQAPGRFFCTLEDGSGNAALDAATCQALQSATFGPVSGSDSIDARLLIKWRKGKAKVELPKRDRVIPLAIANLEALKAITLPPELAPHAASYEVRFNPDGTIGCRMAQTTGSDAGDLALCEKVRGLLKFTPEIDLFGREVSTRRFYRYTP